MTDELNKLARVVHVLAYQDTDPYKRVDNIAALLRVYGDREYLRGAAASQPASVSRLFKCCECGADYTGPESKIGRCGLCQPIAAHHDFNHTADTWFKCITCNACCWQGLGNKPCACQPINVVEVVAKNDE